MKITLFYQNVTVLDYAYLDDHLGVVGNSLKVHVEFIGETDEEGVLYDFSYAKKKVKEIIDRDCDHRLVIPSGVAKREGERVEFDYTYGLYDEKLTYDCPEEGVCEIPSKHVSYENLKTYLEEIILKDMPKNVVSISLKLEEENLGENKPIYHYTHGLKDHYGNCQRLYHGHRNSVDIKVNGKERRDLEEKLSREVLNSNVHFALWENVVNKDEVLKLSGDSLPEGRYSELPVVEIKYTSSQGEFIGSLPGRAVYFMQDESTVENLSIHFARWVKSQVSEHDIVQVRAYEGVAKGSITTL